MSVVVGYRNASHLKTQMPVPVTQAKKSKLREDHCALDTYVMNWCSSSFNGRTMHIEVFNVRTIHIEV